MSTDFKHGGLKWVIDEIHETLKQARVHFESFVEDDEDSAQLQFCTTYLHQVSGSLNMLELGGASLLSEEMELLSQAIFDNTIARREDSFEVLMRALIQLPDYLERLQRGARDLPMVLLPLLNDLRASRGEKLLTEGAVFSVDLSLDNISPAMDNGIDPAELAKKIRHYYHLGLLGWYRDSNNKNSIQKIKKVIIKLKETVKTADFYQLFSLMEAFLDALIDQGINASASTKLLLGQADRYIKQLIDSGEVLDVLSKNDAAELQSFKKNLVFYIAHSKSSSPAIEEIINAYNLAGIIPDEDELEDARASLGGANAELMGAVSEVILTDLANVKEQLDIFVRNVHDGEEFLAEGSEHRDNLQHIIASMTQISDTLAMLGKNAPRNVLQEKTDELKSILHTQQQPDKTTLMDIASALLFVESAVIEMGQGGLFTHSDKDEVVDLNNIDMTEQEKAELIKAAINEAKDELLRIKEGIVLLLEDSARDELLVYQHDVDSDEIIHGLISIGGVLEIIDKQQGSQIVKDCALFLANNAADNHLQVALDEQHHLADIITALEYYLDAIAEEQQDLSVIESVAQSGIDQLMGRESEEPIAVSDLSDALTLWMSDVAAAQARDDLLSSVFSSAEQVKLLQHEHAEEITQQMESMINLVGDKQDSLTEDIASTLRWASKTINRIIDKATNAQETPPVPSEKKNTGQASDYEAAVIRQEAQSDILFTEAAPADEQLTADIPSDKHHLVAAPPVFETSLNNEAAAEEEPSAEQKSSTENAHTDNDDPQQDRLSEPVVDYPDIKKLEVSDDVDAEIMEIFIEEAQEELEKISQLFSQWQLTQDNDNILTEMRRSFHTLKGSGRLVGAYEMGEFSWAFENLLNQVINKQVNVEPVHLATLELAIEMLPEIASAFEQQRLSTVDSSKIAAYAHVLSKGELFAVELLTQIDAGNVDDSIIVDSIDTVAQNDTEDEAIDLVLLEIFSNEALGHIKNIEQCVQRCREQNNICLPDELLMRSLHTLRGSAHMAEVHAIGNISEQMEKAVKNIAEKGQTLDAELIELLEEICQFSLLVLDELNESSCLPAENLPLQEKIAAKYEQVLTLDNLVDAAGISEEISISQQRLDDDFDSDDIEYDEPEGFIDAEIQYDELAKNDSSLQDNEQQLLSDRVVGLPVTDLHLDEEDSTEQAASESISDEYDDELLQIFIEEGEELLESSEQTLHKLRQDGSDAQALNRLLRDMHTLKGGARMAGVSAIGDLSHSFESKLEQFTQQKGSFSSANIDLLLQVQDVLSSMIESLKNGQLVDGNADLIAQIDNIQITAADEKGQVPAGEAEADGPTAIIQGQAQHTGATDESYDDELLEIFLEEAHELMDSSEQALAKLKNEPGDAVQLNQLLRDLHTIKGGARMAGITPVGDLAHSLETQLDKMTSLEQVPDADFFTQMYQAHDSLNEMLDDLKTGKSVQEAAEEEPVADDLSTYIAPQTTSEQQLTGDEAIEPAANDDELHLHDTIVDPSFEQSDAIVASAAEIITPETLLTEQSAQSNIKVAASKGERVRVSADVLDELVNYAGEVSIYRARLDQGSNEVQQSLAEMNSTIIRIREQLRRFEMETEAQIQSRIDQAESLGYERYEEFDPLEFDRFSNMQQLTRAMAESVADLDNIENTMKNLNSESETLLVQQGRVNTDLQEGLMRTRMVPVKSQLTRLRRIIRQTSNELHKEVNFELHGGDQEIDRRVLEKIMAPLEHMLRNAIAHGIETPEQRKQSGKKARGNIKLIIGRDGSEIDIKVIDDGAGVDIAAVKAKAIERGLMSAEANLSDKDIIQFILESGFTTATKVSQISGRGVGMDVVNTEIKQLNGTLDINSQAGNGSVFKILMPLTMSVSRALMVEVGEEIFAIPLVGIENIIRETRDVLQQLTASNDTYYQWNDEQYQFMHLGTVLGINKPSLPDKKSKAPILLARSGEHRVAIFVDGLMGSREIVVKSVGPQLSTVKGVTGATILGDGKISLILDLGVLAREGAVLKTSNDNDLEVMVSDEVMPTIMVVDDSITVRKVTQRLLQRYDYKVITARDGVDAIAMLHESIPDVMLLDVEMPRMDGFELATHMRDDEHFKNIPIIMITSRTGDKHRDRAMKIGVNEYMGKPYQEHDLIANIKKMTQH